MKRNLLCLALFALPFMGFSQYCTNAIPFNCADGDVIKNVTFAGINNDSECENSSTGYSDYTTSVGAASVMAGSSYTISVKVGPSGDGWLYESVGVWIDYNQNNVFDSDEYTYVGTGLNEVLSKEIIISAGAVSGNTRMRVVVAAAIESAFGDQFKCGPVAANNPYGEMEDYTVTISPATACTGTPDAGNATASVSSICANKAFSLSFTGSPMGGYSYQWQSSTNGGTNWNNLGSSQASPSYSVASQSVTTSYRVIVTCTNSSESATSNPVTVSQNAVNECYCGPLTFIDSLFGDDGDEPITSVEFAGINNQTSATLYQGIYHEFFLDKKATVMQGSSPLITIKGNTGGDYTNRFVVFIDWNQNGILNDSGEVYEVSSLLVNSTGVDDKDVKQTINVPGDAKVGETRMRIKKIFGTANFLNPCLGTDYGQAEDYTVVVNQAVECTGAPTIDSFTASVSNTCANNSFSFSVVASPQAAYSYQWQQSTDGGTNWNNLGNAQSSSNYTVASQTQTTQYRVIVTCTQTSTSTTSSAVTVTQNAPTQCYCTANATSTSFEKISNVKLTTSDNSSTIIDNPSTSTTGYEDFTSVIGNVAAGNQYNFTATFSGTSYSADQVFVWIDLDGNGSFNDAGEQVLATNMSTSPWTGTFTIPAGTTPKTTRMRVRLDDTGSASSNTTPCGISTYGQVEDYTLNIGTLAVSDVSKVKIQAYPNPVKDIFNIEAQGKIKSVKVFDASGKQIFTKDLNDTKSQIDFSKFTSGVYVVTTLLQDGSSTSTKVIKK